MGFSVNNQCYDTSQEAGAAVCSSYPKISFSSDGANVYTWSCSEVQLSGYRLSLARSTDGSASALTTYQYLYFPSCQPESFYQDSSALWALGLVAIVAVWALKTAVLKLFTPS